MIDYADIRPGTMVELKDGRIVIVTDVSDQDPYAYHLPDDDGTTRIFPVESILVGFQEGGTSVVTDLSEVTRILQ